MGTTIAASLAAVISFAAMADEQAAPASKAGMERVAVASDRRGFVLQPSGRPFVPWGFNYDHDERQRLLEEYWDTEWAKVEEDFGEMKGLGANVVRVHLQFGKFMQDRETANEQALAQLARLTDLAERLGLYLDITGLACYLKEQVPDWYDELTEDDRWQAQAKFWESVAVRCAASPAVFCYDLMNEPVVSGGPRKAGDWLGPPFAGRFHFVQFISLDPKDRPRPAVAQAWIERLTAAIRRRDKNHLITVGLVPWSLDRPGLTSGFVPQTIARDLDFVSVHIYPERSKVDEALDTLRGFAVGKPVVIEETFPLQCSIAEFGRFIDASKASAAGWIGFNWGKTPEECRKSSSIGDALMLGWLEFFKERATEMGQ